jgi:hypothetical protein
VSVPDRRRELREIDLGTLPRVLQKGGVLDDDGRMGAQGLALLHPGLERVERTKRRVDAERERRALRAQGGVGEDAIAARKSLDGIKQERRAIGPAGRHLGDAADLVTRIGALDPPQRTERVHALDEFAQVLVHSHRSPHACSTRQDIRLRALW